MRSSVLRSAILTSFLLLLVAASAAQSSGPSHAERKFHVLARIDSARVIDVPPSGEPLGDRLISRGVIIDQSEREVIGRITIRGVVVALSGDTYRFQYSLSFRGGTIVARGRAPFVARKPVRARIIEGRRAFAGAEGSLTIGPGPDRLGKLTLRLARG